VYAAGLRLFEDGAGLFFPQRRVNEYPVEMLQERVNG
jgi:hypothetical protein